MRAVAQRVRSATVTVGDREVARMGPGLLTLVGVRRGDTPADARDLARRLVHLRVFDDPQGRMNRSLLDTSGTLGIVSQFTLYGDTTRGRRPSYGEAAPGDQAEPLVEAVAEAARGHGVAVVLGRFGARMEVALTNAGPVTLLLETPFRANSA